MIFKNIIETINSQSINEERKQITFRSFVWFFFLLVLHNSHKYALLNGEKLYEYVC